MANRQIIKTGSLVLMPQTVTGTTTSVYPAGSVPAGAIQIPLSTTPSPKPSVKCSGDQSQYVQSAGSYQALPGVGAGGVTTADTLYLKSDAPVAVQLAMQNLLAGTGTTTSVVYVQGEVTMEFPAGGYLTGLAVQGVANVEWLASGPA